jgi:hypothetical protein
MIFKNGVFKECIKSKAVHISIGKLQDKLIHPLIITLTHTDTHTYSLSERDRDRQGQGERYPHKGLRKRSGENNEELVNQ